MDEREGFMERRMKIKRERRIGSKLFSIQTENHQAYVVFKSVGQQHHRRHKAF